MQVRYGENQRWKDKQKTIEVKFVSEVFKSTFFFILFPFFHVRGFKAMSLFVVFLL